MTELRVPRGMPDWHRPRPHHVAAAAKWEIARHGIGNLELFAAAAKEREHIADVLSELELMRRALELTIASTVATARELSVPWEQIATALNVTKQAAHKRYADGRIKLTPAPAAQTDLVAELERQSTPVDQPPAPRRTPSPTAKRRGAKRDQRALQLITERPGITIPELAEAMELRQNYLYRILPALQKDGRIRKEGRGWFVTPERAPAEQPADDDGAATARTGTGRRTSARRAAS